MIIKNYIKMCEQAEEIQKAWGLKDGDKYVYYRDPTKGVCTYIETEVTHPQFLEGEECFYLPTQEQLFDIWSYLCNTNNKAHPDYLAGDHLPTRFIYEIYNRLKNQGKKAWFDKELCLEIIMKDFFNKTWTGEKWVKYEKDSS